MKSLLCTSSRPYRLFKHLWRSGYLSSCQKSSSIQLNYDEALPFESIPGPRGLPFVGSWLTYKLDPEKIHRRQNYLRELHNKYGSIVKETFAGQTVVHLFEPDDIKQVYETEGKYPTIPPLIAMVQLYRKTKELAPGLGNSNGDEWYKLRSVVQQIMMRPNKSLDYLPSQNEVADDFIRKLDGLIQANGEIPQFNRWISRWGLESSTKICFDTRMGYLEDSGKEEAEAVIQRNSEVFNLATKLWFSLPIYKWFPTPGYSKLFEYEDYINSEGRRLLNMAVQQYKKELAEGTLTDNRFMFLSYMLNSKSVSNKEMMAVIISVFTDTLSTTTQALLFNLYTLANNPEAQEIARQEARTILTESGTLTAQGFNAASYIKSCMKETFRFLPIGIDIQRLSGRDMVIGGYRIPEGTFLALENFLKPHDPSFVPEPERFMPERWTRGDNEKMHPYILTPFSVGTRMCAGRRFAEQDLVVMISKILTKYRLEWHHGKIGQIYRLLQIPDQEVRVSFVPL